MIFSIGLCLVVLSIAGAVVDDHFNLLTSIRNVERLRDGLAWTLVLGVALMVVSLCIALSKVLP